MALAPRSQKPSGGKRPGSFHSAHCLISIRNTAPGLPQGLLPSTCPSAPPFPTLSLRVKPQEGKLAPFTSQVKRTLFINGISKYAESEKIKKHFE